MATDDKDLSTLTSTVETVKALVQQLYSTLKARQEPVPSPTSEPSRKEKPQLGALDLAHDAASLIKAHSTKLSLLIINKPFTPSAIIKVLRELVGGSLPGLVTANELCDGEIYTNVMRKELNWRTQKVLTEFSSLVQEIPLTGEILSPEQKNGSGPGTGKDSLASTGVLWQACDDLMALKKSGIVGIVIKKAEQYQAVLKDALQELKEWGEEEDDEEGDEDEDDATDNGAFSEDESLDPAQRAIDEMFNNQHHIPRDDPHKIRQRLDSSLRRLQLITLMYSAVIKRRFKTLPALPHPPLPPELHAQSSEDPGIVRCVDEVMAILKKIPEIADELANAFYELDTSEIDKRMDECFFTGFAAVELLAKNWEGQKDDFTTWAAKFQLAMKKGW